jgi:hypothetical protein
VTITPVTPGAGGGASATTIKLPAVVVFAAVAVTMRFVFTVTDGAVNTPDCVIVPRDTDHVTFGEAPDGRTVAPHCSIPPEFIGVGQVTVTEVGAGGDDAGTVTTMEVLPLIAGFATLVAMIVAMIAEFGAVYSPVAVMVPCPVVHVTF